MKVLLLCFILALGCDGFSPTAPDDPCTDPFKVHKPIYCTELDAIRKAEDAKRLRPVKPGPPKRKPVRTRPVKPD